MSCIKFTPNTVPKPVVGKEAVKLVEAIQKGGHVANTIALETIVRIVKRHSRTTAPKPSRPLAIGGGNCSFLRETPVLPSSKPNHYLFTG